jgi:hypothetical protein
MTNTFDGDVPGRDSAAASPAEARPRKKAGAADPGQPATRPTATARKALVDRLWRAAERHVAGIEARLPALEAEPETMERDARTLAMLARMVRELSAAETKPPRPATRRKPMKEADDDAPPRDIDAFREELARRLERLRQARAAE